MFLVTQMVQLFVGLEVGPYFLPLPRIMKKGVNKRTPMPFVGTCKHGEGEVQEPFSENQQDKQIDLQQLY